jgi:hypothetical protein
VTEEQRHHARETDGFMNPVVLDSASVNGVDIDLVALGACPHDQEIAFELKPVTDGIGRFVDDLVAMLEDFLVVSIGRPVRLMRLSVGDETRRLDDDQIERGYFADVYFNIVRPDEREHLGLGQIGNFDSPALVTRPDPDTSLQTMLDGWASIWRKPKYRDALNRFCSSYRAPFIFAPHQLASTLGAVEALASADGSMRELPKAEHQRRVRAIIDAATGADVDDAHVSWADRVLRNANRKPLYLLMVELISSVGEVGGRLLADVPDFACRAAAVRNPTVHGGISLVVDEYSYWMRETLGWLVRLRVLDGAGFDREFLARQTLRTGGAFEQTIQRLREAIDDDR